MSARVSNPGPVRFRLDFPPASARRCASSRFGTICFWILLALFLLLLGYLGLLAFTSYNGALQTSAFLGGPHVGGIGLGVVAVVLLAACMSSPPRRY